MVRAGCFIAVLGMLGACSDSGGVPAGTPPAQIPTTPAGGAGKPAGGAPAAPAGGAPSGTAGMNAALAGMTAGGTAGSDPMSGAAPVPGCSAADATVTGSAAHTAAAEILTGTIPCGISGCHGGAMSQVNLMLFQAKDLKALLVDKPACEAPTLMLVDKSGGDAGLTKSWLWQKLTAPIGAMEALTAQAAWGTPATMCPSPNFSATGFASGFGNRMPLGGTETLAPSDLAKVRNWICAGAPGP